MTDAVVVQGITKRFGTTVAVRDVSLAVRSGELFGEVNLGSAHEAPVASPDDAPTGLLAAQRGTWTGLFVTRCGAWLVV